MGRGPRAGLDQRHGHRPARPLAPARGAGWGEHQGDPPLRLHRAWRAVRRPGRPAGSADGLGPPRARPEEPEAGDRRRHSERRSNRRPAGGRHAPAEAGHARPRLDRDPDAGGRRAPAAPGQARQGGPDARALGPQPRRRLHLAGHPARRRDCNRRRARHAHLRRGPQAHERAGARARRRRRQGGRRRGDHVPQPPLLRRGDRRGLEARGRRPLPEHGLCRPAADRGGQAREAGRDRLRRGVRGAARGGRQAAQAVRGLARLGRHERPHARRPPRRTRQRGPAAAGARGQGRDPHERHHRHARRAPPAGSPSRWTRPPRCSRRSR